MTTKNVFILCVLTLLGSGCATPGKPSPPVSVPSTKASDAKLAALLKKHQVDEADPNKFKLFADKVVTEKDLAKRDEGISELDEYLHLRLLEALTYCKPILSGYESVSHGQAAWAYRLSLSGLVAGAVLAPALTAANAAANSASIAGLSGWAGATNFASENLRTSGLDGSEVAKTRNSIVQGVRTALSEALNTQLEAAQRYNAIVKAESECVLYEIAVPTFTAKTN